MRYPMEVYRAGATRVIWSHEEHVAVKAEGWADERPVGEPISLLSEIAEDIKSGEFPKRRNRRRVAEES